MKFSSYHKDDILIVKCRGCIQEEDGKSLAEITRTCLDKSLSSILFDWSDVSYFDSGGLENLITVYKILAEYPGRKLAICLTDPELEQAYRTLNFDKLFPLFNNTDTALEYLDAGAFKILSE